MVPWERSPTRQRRLPDRVARNSHCPVAARATSSDKMTEDILLIGHPLPIPERFRSLKFADDEQVKNFRMDLDSHNSLFHRNVL
jgi:hypothetical protein